MEVIVSLATIFPSTLNTTGILLMTTPFEFQTLSFTGTALLRPQAITTGVSSTMA